MFTKTKLIWLLMPAFFIGSYAFAGPSSKSYTASRGGNPFEFVNNSGYVVKIHDLKSTDMNTGAFPKTSKFQVGPYSTHKYTERDDRQYIGGKDSNKGSFTLHIHRDSTADALKGTMWYNAGDRIHTMYPLISEDGQEVVETPFMDKHKREGRPLTPKFRAKNKWMGQFYRVTFSVEMVETGAPDPRAEEGGGSEPTDPCDPDHPDYDYWSCL